MKGETIDVIVVERYSMVKSVLIAGRDEEWPLRRVWCKR